jgi:lipoate-protein ligase B
VEKQILSFIDLGLCEYRQTLAKQKELWHKRVNNEIPDTLILTEHPPVFTIGKHGKKENLLISENMLANQNIQLYRIERGGDITFHGPGQLIGYPIFMIAEPLVGVRQFIHKIEKVLCIALQKFGISATARHPYIGVWTDNAKIASIGIAISKRVSFHGFALNVTTDLSYFNLINPCGMKEIKMTSMEQVLQKKVSMESVKTEMKIEFSKLFSLHAK